MCLSAYMSFDCNQDVCNHQQHEMIRHLLSYLTAMLVYQRQNLHLSTTEWKITRKCFVSICRLVKFDVKKIKSSAVSDTKIRQPKIKYNRSQP